MKSDKFTDSEYVFNSILSQKKEHHSSFSNSNYLKFDQVYIEE